MTDGDSNEGIRVPFYLDKLGGSWKFAVEYGWFSVVSQQKKVKQVMARDGEF